MPQLRITQKFARDIKVGLLIEPLPISKLLDDWAIDRTIIMRKKIAIITHVKSLLTFFVSYNEIGGAKNIPDCIEVLLSQWFYEQDLEECAEQTIELFKEPITFCKTSDRKLLGHMNDFKCCFEARVSHNYKPLAGIDLEEETRAINGMPVITTKNKYSTPTELMLQLLRV